MKFPLIILWYLLLANTTFAFSQADVLRGSNGRGRIWWDALHYNLDVQLDIPQKSISGTVELSFEITGQPTDSMQIDLQEPLVIDKVLLSPMPSEASVQENIPFSREGNVYWLKHHFTGDTKRYLLRITYHGKPREAIHPPWDGGISWKKDAAGNPWVAVSCQGLGASSWWPCKDYQGDEPLGATMRILPKENPLGNLVTVCNGKLRTSISTGEQVWTVNNPINLYDLTFYMGDYAHWQDTLMGEKGVLTLDHYALRADEQRARAHFTEAKTMLHCFEYWLGPYPFYEDGYKLVQAPYLGMEHQSAVAYGNKFLKGYLGTDRSGTGAGLLFDYIIVHESGHEWFGNSITATDPADNWIHEGLTCYTEALFVECIATKEQGHAYAEGLYKNIKDKKPVIGRYGLNEEGSGDRYDKGSAVLHMIRLMMNDDVKFRAMLRAMNEKFYHKTISTAVMEDFIISYTGLALQPFFQQYLRTAQVPRLQTRTKQGKTEVRLTKTLPNFSLPVAKNDGGYLLLSNTWQAVTNWPSLESQLAHYYLKR